MKYALLTILCSLTFFALGQTVTTSPPEDLSVVITEAYADIGLESEVVRDLLMRMTGLNADQAGEALTPFLELINKVKAAGSNAVMDKQMVKYFVETWGITAVQISDLEKVAGRCAGGGRVRH
jgi:hypothetical protein|tara:strand:- start:194 stop:562 length:369 start_codon:yes stop_codon:yes gene_type:complete